MREGCTIIQKYYWVSIYTKLNTNQWRTPLSAQHEGATISGNQDNTHTCTHMHTHAHTHTHTPDNSVVMCLKDMDVVSKTSIVYYPVVCRRWKKEAGDEGQWTKNVLSRVWKYPGNTHTHTHLPPLPVSPRQGRGQAFLGFLSAIFWQLIKKDDKHGRNLAVKN